MEQLRQLTDPAHVTTETVAYMEKMTYQDWKTIIEGPVLTKTLANIGVKDASATKAKFMQVLVEQQSLFTMTAH